MAGSLGRPDAIVTLRRSREERPAAHCALGTKRSTPRAGKTATLASALERLKSTVESGLTLLVSGRSRAEPASAQATACSRSRCRGVARRRTIVARVRFRDGAPPGQIPLRRSWQFQTGAVAGLDPVPNLRVIGDAAVAGPVPKSRTMEWASTRALACDWQCAQRISGSDP
jgi:hypothetical protein